MTNRGRPRGSKNKVPRGKRGPMHVFLRELPKEEQKNATELQAITGISLKKICGDAMAEGLATLREDTYAELIRFNERRGKVIHEKDLEKPSLEGTAKPLEPSKTTPEWLAQKLHEHNTAHKINLPASDDGATQSADVPVDSGHVDGDAQSVYIPQRSSDAVERSGRGSEIVQMPGSDSGESIGE